MEIGESVAVVMAMQDDGKCIFCGESHSDPKKEDIKEVASVAGNKSKWGRVDMQGKLQKIPAKTKIYPDNSFPPGAYRYQGHHCIALSSLVSNANSDAKRKDKRLRLNYFLDKVGFYPNRDENCIGLPERTGYGCFQAFWDAIDAKAPLQMHGPHHDEAYFAEVEMLISRLLGILLVPDLCETADTKQMEDDLKQLIEWAENKAFNSLAKNDDAWRLHASEQETAVRIYTAPVTETFTHRGKNNTTTSSQGKGHIGKKITYPNPGLDEGVFA